MRALRDACRMNIMDELHEIYSAMTELTSTLRKGFDLHSRQLDRQAEQILRLMDRVERLELVESARMVGSDEVAEAILRNHERGEE